MAIETSLSLSILNDLPREEYRYFLELHIWPMSGCIITSEINESTATKTSLAYEAINWFIIVGECEGEGVGGGKVSESANRGEKGVGNKRK